MAGLKERIEGHLQKRKHQGNLRSLTTENKLIDFCSNDYLGFARSKELEDKILEAVRNCKLPTNGATGSRLISGNFSLTENVEAGIAKYHDAKSALLFNSGYNANVGFFSCVPRSGDTILYDELVHASIHDGMRLSKATKIAFAHNDLSDLASKLQNCSGEVFIATESVYSMDGDCAPLLELVAFTKKKKNIHLVIDEAHGTGVIGSRGQGLVSSLGLAKHFLARIHTYGKAHGTHGASILGSPLLRNYLINFSRPLIYTTAMPLQAVLGIQCSYQYLEEHVSIIEQLERNIVLFKNKLKDSCLASLLIPSNSPIQSLLVPGNRIVKELAKIAYENGFMVKAILSPTVPIGKERLRICLHSYNTQKEIEDLVLCLSK